MTFAASENDSHAAPTIERERVSGKNAEPVVSVVIPTFNRAHLIARSLRSVLAQTFTAYEVLVVDDGSSDNTEAVVRSLDDARIRYFWQENGGTSAARNRGMREARGEFIAFLDSDDEWLPEKLELQVAHFRALPDRVGLINAGAQTLTDGAAPETFIPNQSGNLHRQLLERNVLHAGTVMIRKSVVERVGYFDERLPAIEDYDYWVRISACYEIDFVPVPLMRYYDTASPERRSRATRANLRARELFYRKHAAEMRRHGIAHLFLEESARRHLKRSHWDPAKGRELVRSAIAEQPRALRLYALLAKSWIPTPIFRLLVRVTQPLQRA